MKHPHIKNDFFSEKVAGPERNISIQDAIYLAIGRRLFFSKRLAPAGTICNARIYTENGEFVYSSDLNLFEKAVQLENVADLYKTELFVFHESGSDYCWRSSEPHMWQGAAEIDGEYKEGPHSFEVVKPIFEQYAKQRQRQWALDHGVARRNFKEYTKDVSWHIKHISVVFQNCRAGGCGYIESLYRVVKYVFF